MQDVQNIPNPDTNSIPENDEFGSHGDLNPDIQKGDVETPGNEGDIGEPIPLPAGRDVLPLPENRENDDSDADLM